ncbi:MAG TPA: type II toxin-antitoxin system VapC family toxin [Thermoanaerobaculia bacterium]
MILLDTHAWLWLNGAVEKLPRGLRATLERADQPIYLSAASAWEIAIKYRAGKLTLPLPPEEYLSARLEENGVASLPIRQSHALRAAALPLHHRDPFDRILVAQAQIEELTLVTADPVLSKYEVKILWPHSA